MILLLWLAGCSERPFGCQIPQGYEFYYELPESPPSPHSVATVRQALPSWGLPSSHRDQAIASFLELHVQSWRFWAQIYARESEYLYVVDELRTARLPELLAAIPYQTSRFERWVGMDCSAGPWGLPVDTRGLSVRNCRVRGASGYWSPGDTRPILDQGLCLLDTCEIDERLELSASTRVAIASLRQTWATSGHDPMATLEAHARHGAAPALAQHLAAACAIEETHPGSFPQRRLDYCERISVPSPAEVAFALGTRVRP
jgi:hypothetical protein